MAGEGVRRGRARWRLLPVEGDPVLRGQRACLFQHIFHGRFYGYDCHLETPERWILEEVEAPLP